MSRIITKEHAIKISRKLGATISSRKNKAHDIAQVIENGRIIAFFGIRRGSEKDKGHDHISRDLHLSPHDAKLLAQCPLSRDGWLEIMRQKGFA